VRYKSAVIFEHDCYRSFLRTELADKAKARPGYSLRAFSERIGVSNSFLSQVLSAKKSLSMEQAFKIAVNLELTDAETQYLCLLVQLAQERDPEFREVLSRRLEALNPGRKTHDLSVDHFKTIADWHHYAILELTYLTGFTLTAASAARKLGIAKAEAELAIDRLLRLELLERGPQGRLRKSRNYIAAESQVPNGALRKFHRGILEKAIASLEEQVPGRRQSATDILSIDSRFLPEVDRLSREFSAAVIELTERSKVKDATYALAVHFIDLTFPPKGKTP
jgi:uncharacterized protein (TIGR02147 family)